MNSAYITTAYLQNTGALAMLSASQFKFTARVFVPEDSSFELFPC
jgi:hypothetical protein